VRGENFSDTPGHNSNKPSLYMTLPLAAQDMESIKDARMLSGNKNSYIALTNCTTIKTFNQLHLVPPNSIIIDHLTQSAPSTFNQKEDRHQ